MTPQEIILFTEIQRQPMSSVRYQLMISTRQGNRKAQTMIGEFFFFYCEIERK
jgi:hypothetical protein